MERTEQHFTITALQEADIERSDVDRPLTTRSRLRSPTQEVMDPAEERIPIPNKLSKKYLALNSACKSEEAKREAKRTLDS